MQELARRAVKRLGIREKGFFHITFISCRRMRAVNRRFLNHDRSTDVLSFRYAGEAVAGEVLIAPREAERYAKAHDIAYHRELARYVVHGLLHWLGHHDRTLKERQAMRVLEDQLLDTTP